MAQEHLVLTVKPPKTKISDQIIPIVDSEVERRRRWVVTGRAKDKVQDQWSYGVKWAPEMKSKVCWENQSAKLGFSSANSQAESGWLQMAQ